jgi:hypothetical protein
VRSAPWQQVYPVTLPASLSAGHRASLSAVTVPPSPPSPPPTSAGGAGGGTDDHQILTPASRSPVSCLRPPPGCSISCAHPASERGVPCANPLSGLLRATVFRWRTLRESSLRSTPVSAERRVRQVRGPDPWKPRERSRGWLGDSHPPTLSPRPLIPYSTGLEDLENVHIRS